MSASFANRAACIEDLKQLTRKRIPGFAFDYLVGGCNSENGLQKNRHALDEIYLEPQYLTTSESADITTELFGQRYAAPFGIAPLGLSGLIWPRASEYQARAAKEANIPFVLSTLATTSIEKAAECAEDNFWFQLYPPSDLKIRADLIRRAQAVGCQHLVVTIDVPAAGRRPRDIRNGLAIPPKITPRSIAQTLIRPAWALATAKQGMPQFASMMPYMKDISNLQDVANYVRTTLKDVVDQQMLQQIRDAWSEKLIVKGILSVGDAEKALAAGADGLIVSNHGGRQLDAAKPSVTALQEIIAAVGDRTLVMVDSGVESGPDIARFLAQGAKMVFAGRAFMYGVGAFGQPGAGYAIELLQNELTQVMEQLRCSSPYMLGDYLP